MKVLFFVLALAVVLAIADRNYEQEFGAWTKKHSKTYSATEMRARFQVWKRNLHYIEAHNTANTHKYTLAMNHFGDLAPSEFRRLHLSGFKFNQTQFAENSRGRLFVPRLGAKPADDTVDWRNKGAVTPVKNQQQCGSCWSFSTTGSTEGCNAIKTGNLPSLSEQNLIDCSASYGNQGCDGGLMTQAMDYIIKNGGLDSESSYPYKARVGKCEFKKENVAGTLTGYNNVAQGDEGALAQAVAQGPVSIAIDASQNSFQFYSSGVYSDPSCSSTALDHGVLAVGYGQESDGAFWIVKNSWSASWGLQGYILMARNDNNMCGVASSATLPTC